MKGRLTICLLVLFLMLGVSGQLLASGQVHLRLGHDQSTGHPYDLGAQRFAQGVEERTNGAVTVTIYPAAQLGDTPEQIEGLQMGTLDISIAGFSHVSQFIPQLGLFGVPYLIEDDDHFAAIFDGEIGAILDKISLETANIRLLTTFTSGYRLLFNSRRPVRSPADLDGLKVRVMTGEADSMSWEAFGATPTPMPYSELYSALQAGVVDGGENEPASVLQNRFYEAAPYLALTNHQVLPMGVFMSNIALQKLPQEYQEIIFEEAQKAALWQRAYITEQNHLAIKRMEEEYNAIVTEVDIEAFAARGKGVQDVIAEKLKAVELLDMVRQAAQK
ncbi:MAG: TRAP transporter substrate-binding protein [Limnochordia bacterium]|jgi:tripartite ATP-independent transporter DctP family solute receptor